MKRDHSEGTKRHALLHADPVRPATSTLPSVLIVDDSAADAAAASAVLRECGYAPVWVRDGLDAIEAIRCGAYGCVLLDLRMAVFGGQELVDYLALESPEIL